MTDNPHDNIHNSATTSAVSWSAIIAGAAAAAALSLLLFILGSGLGFSALSPWANDGASAEALGVSTVLWITLTQLAASALGGYLAGRLRIKWVNTHNDEVYFRDTAHGLLTWAVATLLMAALAGSTASSLIGGGLKAGASVAAGLASGAGYGASQDDGKGKSSTDDGPMGYFIDTLFRSDRPAPQANDADARAEAARIIGTDLRAGQLPADDRAYLGRMLAQRNGLSQADAEARVSNVFNRANQTLKDSETKARQAADTARKAAAGAALWMAFALLVGAFVASLAATLGGKQRDGVA